MKDLHLILLIITASLLTKVSSGQFMHLSEFDHAPMILSPANAGAFNGSVRVGASYREQFRGFITHPFQTTVLFVDAPIAAGLPDNQWLGVGMTVGSTSAGDLATAISRVSASLSYHRFLDRKQRKTFGGGLQITVNNVSIGDLGAARFEDELLDSGTVSDDRSLLQSMMSSRMGLSGGLYFQNKYSKRLTYKIGLAMQNALAFSTQTSTQTAGSNPASIRQLTANVDFAYQLNNRWMFEPGFLYQKLSFSDNVVLSTGLSHLLNSEKAVVIKTRLGYRFQDAAIISVGAEFGLYSVMLTYDMTVSSAQIYNGVNGAFQLGFYRIFNIYPKAKVEYKEICPRL